MPDLILPIVLAFIGIISAGIGSVVTSFSNRKVTEATVAHKISESYDGLVQDLNIQYDRTIERLKELQIAYEEKEIEIRQHKQTVMLQEKKIASLYVRMKQLEKTVRKMNGGGLIEDGR